MDLLDYAHIAVNAPFPFDSQLPGLKIGNSETKASHASRHTVIRMIKFGSVCTDNFADDKQNGKGVMVFPVREDLKASSFIVNMLELGKLVCFWVRSDSIEVGRRDCEGGKLAT